jgi:hypothetical protein
VPGGGGSRHVCADLGEDDRGGDRPDAGDLIQACRRRERGRLRLDLFVDGGDVGVNVIDAVQHPREQEPVVGVEVAVERLLEPADLGPHPRPCQLRQHLPVALIIARPALAHPRQSDHRQETLHP